MKIDTLIVTMFVLLVFSLGFWAGTTYLQTGRFVPVTPNTALDTVTGRLCWSYDPIGGQDKIPVCNAH